MWLLFISSLVYAESAFEAALAQTSKTRTREQLVYVNDVEYLHIEFNDKNYFVQIESKDRGLLNCEIGRKAIPKNVMEGLEEKERSRDFVKKIENECAKGVAKVKIDLDASFLPEVVAERKKLRPTRKVRFRVPKEDVDFSGKF